MARTRVDAARKPKSGDYFVTAERGGSGHYLIVREGDADKQLSRRTIGTICDQDYAVALADFLNASRLLHSPTTDDEIPF